MQVHLSVRKGHLMSRLTRAITAVKERQAEHLQHFKDELDEAGCILPEDGEDWA